MFENIASFFKKLVKAEKNDAPSKDTAKERLHLVLMQDRAHVSADFLELMKQEIIEVIKKYIEVEETAIDVRLTNEISEDGSKGAPSLYANIPIVNIKNGMKAEIEENKKQKEEIEEDKEEDKEEKIKDVAKEENDKDVKEETKKEKVEENIEKNKEDKTATKKTTTTKKTATKKTTTAKKATKKE